MKLKIWYKINLVIVKMSSTRNLKVEMYKENFEQMKKLPFVKFLLKENRLLKKENKGLKDTVVKLCRKVLIKEEHIEVKKENIVYEIEHHTDGVVINKNKENHDVIVRDDDEENKPQLEINSSETISSKPKYEDVVVVEEEV